MLYELRQYTAKPGQRAALVRVMEKEVIPFQVSKGMVILGSFISEQDDDGYIWIRRFKNEAEREKLYKDVYQSEHWTKVIAPKIGPLLDRESINVRRMIPTAKSPLQ